MSLQICTNKAHVKKYLLTLKGMNLHSKQQQQQQQQNPLGEKSLM